MTPISELIILIKLLKAEGVKEYSDNGLHLHFHSASTASDSGGRPARAEGPAQADETARGRFEAEAASDAEAAIELPPALRKLNPNYLKLAKVERNG